MATHARLTHDDVISALGWLDDAKVAAIIGTGASLEEVIEAQAWLEEDEEFLADAGKQLVGTVAQVYEILSAEEDWPEE